MKKISLLFVCVAIMVLLGFSIYACNIFKDDNNPPPSSTPANMLVIDEESIEWDIDNLGGTYALTITGVITNVSGRTLSYADVTFTVYDKYDNVIGTALDNINYLSAGATWKFSAIAITTEKPSRFVFANFTIL